MSVISIANKGNERITIIYWILRWNKYKRIGHDSIAMLDTNNKLVTT